MVSKKINLHHISINPNFVSIKTKNMKKNVILSSGLLLLAFSSSVSAQFTFGWARKTTSNTTENAVASYTDATGNVYTVGNFTGMVDFNPGTGVFNLTSSGSTDVFIQKLNSSGNFVWARKVGGSLNDAGTSIFVDASSNVYVTGSFEGMFVDFNPGTAVNYLSSTGRTDVFMLKLNSSGNYVWANNMGGTLEESGTSITADASGNIYVGGLFKGSSDFNPSAATNSLVSGIVGSTYNFDGFIAKYNSSGNYLWAKKVGGNTGDDVINQLVVNAQGIVYSTGYFKGIVDFNPGTPVLNLTAVGGDDFFVQKLDANGNFLWAKSTGGSSTDIATSLAIDASSNVFVTGYFAGTVDFNPGTAVDNKTATGNSMFIQKLDVNGNYVSTVTFVGVANVKGFSIATHSLGDVFVTGKYSGTVDFDPGNGVYNLTTTIHYSENIFILQLSNTLSFKSAGGIGNGISWFSNPTICVDNSKNAIITGQFAKPIDFDPTAGVFTMTSTLTGTSTYSQDGFVFKLGTISGNRFEEEEEVNVSSIELESVEFSTFPNPAKDFITINTYTNGSLEIYSISGALVSSEIINSGSTQKSLNNYKTGTYIVRFISQQGVSTSKIVIEE